MPKRQPRSSVDVTADNGDSPPIAVSLPDDCQTGGGIPHDAQASVFMFRFGVDPKHFAAAFEQWRVDVEAATQRAMEQTSRLVANADFVKIQTTEHDAFTGGRRSDSLQTLAQGIGALTEDEKDIVGREVGKAIAALNRASKKLRPIGSADVMTSILIAHEALVRSLIGARVNTSKHDARVKGASTLERWVALLEQHQIPRERWQALLQILGYRSHQMTRDRLKKVASAARRKVNRSTPHD